jgi:hypothetical protein
VTLDQAERLWKGEAVPEADPDDARELLNYRSAFEFVSECLDSGDPITEGMIREIHRKLVEGVRGGSAAPGEYWRIQNYVVNASTQQVIYTPAHSGGGAGDDIGAGEVAKRRAGHPSGCACAAAQAERTAGQGARLSHPAR